MSEFFKREATAYKLSMNPVDDYIKQSATYLSKKNGKTIAENMISVQKTLKKSNIHNPIATYRYKNDVGDIEIREDTITDYIKDSINSNELMVPSFTTYVHPSEKKSIHAEFLEDNISKRKQDKHNAFKFKQLGDDDKFLYYNTLQKTRKIFNNSLSGAYASKSTILYNPSAHYTLTSTTRSVTSIGNAISESIVAGNKHFKEPATVINYITSIITIIDMFVVGETMQKYNLHKPTSDEVYESILRSANRYWVDEVYQIKIKELLDTLNSDELAAVLYTNDAYHMRIYNDVIMRDLIGGMAKRVTSGSTDNLKDINNAKEGIMNLVHHVCADDIRGKNINYKELVGTDILMTLASTAKNIETYLMEYKDLIQTFFVTDVMPPTIGYIKDMYRDVIVLSDTDSTCGSYDNWVEWYIGSVTFTQEATAISAAVMTLNTQIIDHYLKVFTSNMNVDKKDVELIKMKNEFYWDVFTSTNVSKHYFGNVRIQEGNVFEKPDIELKGVHLIASNVNPVIRKQAHTMIEDIQNDITNGRGINLLDYITLVANVERKIITDIKSGSTEIFKMDKIKEENAYKLDRTRSPFLHHLLWEEVFAGKYGTPGEPTYMVINIPTLIQSKRSKTEYLETIKDPIIRDALDNFLAVRNKDSLGTFRVPLVIASEKGLPEEMFSAVDIHKVVTNSTNVFYMILESIGFYRKPDLLISEMGY